ncbi:MAG: pentapeptide repeat-containing protein [Magnetococcales bacterium]|nr:pentapeptide repeat-containing protein [Magnetococcales bacterium]
MNNTLCATFYSFKGGVGRSMLLANVAAALALDLVEPNQSLRSSKRVLIWDLDLEAPGLHLLGALTPQQPPTQGFLDWLADWQVASGDVVPDENQIKQLLEKSICPLGRLVKPARDSTGAAAGHAQKSTSHWEPLEGLSLLPAMSGDTVDLVAYALIDWHQILVERADIGKRLFLAILAQAAREFDYILIDSRTGLTDLGGILTAVLPHVTVLVANYSRQNTHGISAIHQALTIAVDGHHPARAALDQPALELITVASPVPAEDARLLEERRAVWHQQFPNSQALEIPLLPELLLLESLPVLSGTDVQAKPYVQVAMRLNLLRQNDQAEREKEAEAKEIYSDPSDQRGKGSDQGFRFEQQVARLLSLLGYSVEEKQLVGGNQVDLIARQSRGFEMVCYLVECRDHKGPKGKAVLEKLQGWTQGEAGKKLGCRAMVVAHDFTYQARSYAKEQNMVLTTPEEMENMLFPFPAYLAGLRQAFEQSRLARTYVGQKVLLEAEPQPEGVDLLEYAVRWATGQVGKNLWLLLGDYGTGKTAFFKRLAYELAVRAEKEPGQPMPLAINLKQFPNAVSLKTLIQEYLRDQQQWIGDPEILLYLLEQGRLVLLLDAFDEMGTATIGRSVEEQFRQLAWAATRGKARVLITCRTHFFRDQQQIKRQFLTAQDSLISQDSPLGQVARGFDAALDELLLFNPAQIEQFLRQSLQNDPQRMDEAQKFIENTYNLGNLAPRPVMLEMILGSLDTLMAGAAAQQKMTPAQLYHAYTSEWLEDRSSKQLQTGVEQRRKLLEHLAWLLWSQPQNRIHHQALVDFLATLQSREFAGLDLTRVDLELRTATFLTRTNEGYFSFSHKSFLEFFCGRFLYRALQDKTAAANLAKALNTTPLTKETGAFFADMLGESDRETLAPILRDILSQDYQPRVSENALRLAYGVAEQRSDSGGVLQTEMKKMVPAGAKLARAELAGDDLFGGWLRGADLAGANLSRTSLVGADLSGANLTGAILEGANLFDVQAVGTNFSQANMRGADLPFGRFEQAIFAGADMRGVSGQEAGWTAADFNGANLAGAVLSPVDAPDKLFAGANLEDVVWAAVSHPSAEKLVDL